MASVTLYNKQGASVGDLTLDASVFEVVGDQALIHEAVVAQQANARQVIAHAKDRSEVAGSGKKPWKQKGTGRARHGSRRSPIWSGGGVTFGPSNLRNFTKKMNRKARQKALAMVLSDKVAAEKLVAVDDLLLEDVKTKVFSSVLEKLPVAGKKTLIVLDTSEKDTMRAARNIPRITTIGVGSLNIVDLLAHEYVLISQKAAEQLTQTYKRA